MNDLDRELTSGARLRIPNDSPGVIRAHRGRIFEKFIDFDSNPKIGGISVTAVELPEGWYIVANHPMNDATFVDLGPFPTAEVALLTIQIAKD